MDNLKVIFHIDEMNKWNLTLNNISNFIKAKSNSKIILLANAEAVKGYLLDSSSANKIENLMANSVEFLACNNALKSFNLSEKDLVSNVKIVPAGVVALVEKQNENFRYIKP